MVLILLAIFVGPLRAWPGFPQALAHVGQVQSTDGLRGRAPGSNM